MARPRKGSRTRQRDSTRRRNSRGREDARDDARHARDDAHGHTSKHRASGHQRSNATPQQSSAAAVENVSRAATRQARTRPLRQLLEGIGTPEQSEFKPDSFQLEALAALETADVLVTAPTGSGKTWIAREEIRRLLDAGKRAWYTSPLKALTNSKYHEFCDEFGADSVGILTGDRKEKSDAPLIVGTTEDYRNQLFDALRGGQQVNADLVVLDEAHYLADEERGHVWEEAIILTPPRVRMLLLSATVGRAEEFADWIAEVRGVHVRVIPRPGPRPVPLRAAFLYPDGGLAPLFDERGPFNTEIARFMQTAKSERQSPQGRFRSGPQSRRPGLPEMPPSILLAALGSYDLLPSIVFLPTRRRCDEAAAEAAFAPRRGSADAARRDARREMLERLVEQYPEMRRHRHWDIVLRGGVASHHAGHMPAWKLAIEHLMSAGLLDAIFATATVAAGVDFPARTVVLENIDVRRAQGWRPLTASELQQMTGRAGRRGRDRVGFVVAAPGLHQNPQKLASLLEAEPDPLESRFRATYTTLLNLLDAYQTFAQVRDIAERSFARRDAVAELARLERARAEAERRMRSKLAEAGCDLPPDVARGLERLAAARSRLLEDAPPTPGQAFMRWLDREVVPGRVVGVGRGSRRLVFVTERRGDGLAGVRDNGRRVTLALERICRGYEETHKLHERAREDAVERLRARPAAPLREPRLRDARASADDAVALINDLIESLSSNAGERARCEEALWSVMQEAETVERMERRVEAVRGEVWQPFERRARVLHHFGYLDFFAERVTDAGRWLADLRLDRPLLVGEAIGRGLFASLHAPRAAALMAALAADAQRDYGEFGIDHALLGALAQVHRLAFHVASR